MSPPESNRTDVTELLLAWSRGDETALTRLMPLVYEELHAIAARFMRDERDAPTLQTTALVHEAYIRLIGSDVDWVGRKHFIAVAARTMRRVLVDHARGKQRLKRGGADVVRVTLEDNVSDEDRRDPLDVIALDTALDELARLDERKARALELHYFAGLDHLEVAETLGVAAATVDRDMRFARNWIYDYLRTD